MVKAILCLIVLMSLPLLIKEWDSYEKIRKKLDEKKNKKKPE